MKHKGHKGHKGHKLGGKGRDYSPKLSQRRNASTRMDVEVRNRSMSHWPASKAKVVLRALERIGWREKRRISKGGSHRQLIHHNDLEEFTWSFHDGDEIGPAMLARIAKKTGLKPEDL